MSLTVARTALQERYAAVRDAGSTMELAEHLAALTELQELSNLLDATRAQHLAHVAAISERQSEDGTWVQSHRGLGHVEEDAPELVAPCLGVSVHVAQRRVSEAVELLTRAPALVAAMARGELDGFRAGLVAGELAQAPGTAAAAVVDALVDRAEQMGGWLETAGPLRRRAARLLASLAPETAQEQAASERRGRSLVRFLGGVATDEWRAVVPVEESRTAWSAIDEVARGFLADGSAETLEQARADALLALVNGRATTTVHLYATHSGPGQSLPVVPSLSGEVELVGFGAPGPASVPARWLAERLASGQARWESPVLCHPETGAVVGGTVPAGLARGRLALEAVVPPEAGDDSPGPYRIPPALRRLVQLRDGRCRFPGCTISVRSCDLDHVRPWPLGPTRASNLACLCRRHHRLKQTGRWRPRLAPDGVMTWVDPVGRVLTTLPTDHLPPVAPLAASHAAQAEAVTPEPAVVASWGAGPLPDPPDRYGLPSDSAFEEALTRLLVEEGAYDPIRQRFREPAGVGARPDTEPCWGDHPRYDEPPF